MLPLLLPGVSVDPLAIAKSLVVLMLIPLALSLLVRARAATFATRIKPYFDRLSNLSLIALITFLVVANFQNVIGVFGTRAKWVPADRWS